MQRVQADQRICSRNSVVNKWRTSCAVSRPLQLQAVSPRSNHGRPMFTAHHGATARAGMIRKAVSRLGTRSRSRPSRRHRAISPLLRRWQVSPRVGATQSWRWRESSGSAIGLCVAARLAVVKQDREPISIRLKAFGCLRTGNLAAWTNSTDNPTAPRQPDDMHQPDSPNPLKRKASDDESSNLDDVTLYWQQRMQRKKQAHVGATADQIRLLSQSFQPTCKYKVHPLSRKRP